MPPARAASPLSSASASSASTAIARRAGSWRRRRPLVWVAVIAAAAFAVFLALFSLDTPPFTPGFIMHNIPTLIVLIGAALAWWRSWAGAAWLAAAAILAIIWFEPFRQRLDWLLVIPGPPLIIALLLMIDALRRRD